MYRLIRQVDANAVRGGMQRCYLHSKKIVWLCSEHQRYSRGFLSDDDVEIDDIIINTDETDNATSKLLINDNSTSLDDMKSDNTSLSISTRDLVILLATLNTFIYHNCKN